MARAIAVNVKTKREETKQYLAAIEAANQIYNCPAAAGVTIDEKESTKPVPEESASHQSTHAEPQTAGGEIILMVKPTCPPRKRGRA